MTSSTKMTTDVTTTAEALERIRRWCSASKTSCDVPLRRSALGGVNVRRQYASSQVYGTPSCGAVPRWSGSTSNVLNPVIAWVIVEVVYEVADRCDRRPAVADRGEPSPCVSTASAPASAWDVPFIGVNHLEGHLLSPFLEHLIGGSCPAVALIVVRRPHLAHRGRGHGDYRLLAAPDDAAGEAFDKVGTLPRPAVAGGPAARRSRSRAT